MNSDELKIKHKLSQLVSRLVDTCEVALEKHRALGEALGFPPDVPLRFIAAEEAESVLRSFAASDRQVLAEELLPGYRALGQYLNRYAGDLTPLVQREVEDLNQFKVDDRWKYVPSDLFRWLIKADGRRSTDFAVDYAEVVLDLADIVCRLDGHIDSNEQRDLRAFAEMLDLELREAKIAQDGDFDLVRRRWHRRCTEQRQHGRREGGTDVDDLLDVLLTSRTTSTAAATQRKQAAPCASCAKVGVFQSQHCDECAEAVPVVSLDLRYLEIEDSLDDGVPVSGPCSCGAAFLHSRRSSERAWLDCHHCGNQHRIRLVPRHRLQTA